MVAAFVKAAPALVDLAAVIDFADVQGIVRFGHGKLTEACFCCCRSPIAPPRSGGCRARR